MTQGSNITITAHLLDEDFQLVSYVLDTQEIKVTHTSEHLLTHIHGVLKDYDITEENNSKITLNYNATNSDDIHEQDIESADELNLLSTEISDIAEFSISDDNLTQVES